MQSSQGVSQNIRDIVRIHQENQALKKALEKYAYLDREYQQTKEENTRLKQLNGFSPSSQLRSVV
ncbi:MAG: hypothetical protein ACYC5N_12090, partial [Endomicrobiales bacterium]